MTASAMRKMHVPAYAAGVEGVHCEEKRGVLWSVVKTIEVEDMLLDDMSMPSIVGARRS